MGKVDGHVGNYVCNQCRMKFGVYSSKCPNCASPNSLYKLETYIRIYGEGGL